MKLGELLTWEQIQSIFLKQQEMGQRLKLKKLTGMIFLFQEYLKQKQKEHKKLTKQYVRQALQFILQEQIVAKIGCMI